MAWQCIVCCEELSCTGGFLPLFLAPLPDVAVSEQTFRVWGLGWGLPHIITAPARVDRTCVLHHYKCWVPAMKRICCTGVSCPCFWPCQTLQFLSNTFWYLLVLHLGWGTVPVLSRHAVKTFAAPGDLNLSAVVLG